MTWAGYPCIIFVFLVQELTAVKVVKMIKVMKQWRLHPLCLAVAVGSAVYTNFVPVAAQDPTIPAE